MAELDYQYLSTLVERIKSGDSDAFAELYAATFNKQYRFAYQYLKDRYLAQDAIQEVYILVLKNIHKLKDSKVFISWLNQINFRVCFYLAKRQNRYNSELNDYDKEEITGQAPQRSNPENKVINQTESDYILEQVLNLPYYESQAIIMRYYHNMKIDEIAVAIDVSSSTVKRYLASGKRKLQEVLNI